MYHVVWESEYLCVCTPLGDPRVTHIYCGAIGTLGERVLCVYTIG